MKTIKELLEITLEAIEEKQFPDIVCICDHFIDMNICEIITAQEKYLLYDFMDENEIDDKYDLMFWWEPGKMKPRIQWLKEQIKRLEK